MPSRTSQPRFVPQTGARLGVAVCTSDGSDLGPKGQHVRWFVPRSVGFPEKGFDVVRVGYDAWRRALRSGGLATRVDLDAALADLGDGDTLGSPAWSGRERRWQPHPDLLLVTRVETRLAASAGTVRVVDTGGARHLLLRFASPVIFCRLDLRRQPEGDPSTAFVTGLHKSAPLVSVPLGGVVEIEQPGLTDLLVPLGFERLVGIAFVRETDVLAAIDAKRLGELRATIPRPSTATQAYNLVAQGLGEGIRNRMLTATSIDDVRDRYRPAEVGRLVHHLDATVGQPDLTVAATPSPGQTPASVRVLDHLALAALDPNVARMLASYWVDPDLGDYLYAVRAIDARNPVHGFGFTRAAAGAPTIPAPVTGRQLPGIRYHAARPRARVALTWKRATGDYRDPAKAVFVDMRRTVDDGSQELLTARAPRLISARTADCVGDDDVPAGVTAQYRITPIDVFGREGPAVDSNQLEVRDLAAPVPPKNLRATVRQTGFPWHEPTQRRRPDILKGVLAASAEFGEAQHAASPDAVELRWRWRAGPLDGPTGDPASWTWFATQPIVPPLRGLVEWDPATAITDIPLRVSAIEPVSPAERDPAGRLAPILRDAADRAPTQPGTLVALLLDRPLLEPGLFDRYEVHVGAHRAVVAGTHAGIGFADDDPGRTRTARLVVERSAATDALRAGDTVTLRHPVARSWSQSELQSWIGQPGSGPAGDVTLQIRVRMHVPEGIGERPAAGGELAIDLGGSTPSGVIVGRVVSDVEVAGGVAHVLVRVRPAGLWRLLLARLSAPALEPAARFHPPYVLEGVTIGLNGERGDIEIVMPPTRRFTQLWISATTLDAGGRESTALATPFETRVVNPPPVVTPSPPYPAGGDATTPTGTAAPPDQHGRAVVRVAWDPVEVADAPAGTVRYELGRALDTSIVASDRDRWLRGGGDDHLAGLGVEVAEPITGALAGGYVADPGGRTIRVVATRVDGATLDGLPGLAGRIRVEHDIGGQRRLVTHRLLRAVRDGQAVTLLCQPFVEIGDAALGTVPPGAGFSAQPAPDYTPVAADDGHLREVADRDGNETAFGVVTGVPTDATDFVDTIPGRGGNRYLYKVRAVFPGELRSVWSPCSVAFRPLDLTPADPPRLLRTHRGAGHDVYVLARPDGDGMRGLRLLRRLAGGGVQAWRTLLLDAGDGEEPLAPAALRPTGRLLDLAPIAGGRVLSLDAYPRLLGLYDAGLDPAALPDDADQLPGAALARNVVQLAVPADRPLAARIAWTAEDVEWVTTVEGRHEVVVAHDDLGGVELLVQTVKEAVRDGATIRLDSEPVRLR